MRNVQSGEWQVYVLTCADQTLYTGITTDVERRLAEHNGERAGGAKYTAARRPVELFYVETALNRSQAARREWQIKQLTRNQKLNLASKFNG